MKSIVLVVLASVLLACDHGLPTLRTENNQDFVTVHLETLGEYPTTVSRLRLQETQSGDILWEVQRASGTTQLWNVRFREGMNPAGLDAVTGGGSLEVVVPANSEHFFLEASKEYTLTIWGAAGDVSRSVNFMVGGTVASPHQDGM